MARFTMKTEGFVSTSRFGGTRSSEARRFTMKAGGFVSTLVSGEKLILRRLRIFMSEDPRGAKMALRRASTKAVRGILLPVYRVNVARAAYDTGALHDTVNKRAIRAKRGWYKGKIGSRLYISRNKLIETRTERQSGDYIPRDKSGKPFFYPAVVEYGSATRPPKRLMHHTITKSERPTRRVFIAELRRQIQLIRSIK